MKRLAYIFCVFMLLVCGCSSNQVDEKETVTTETTQTIAPTPTTSVEFGKVRTEEPLFEEGDMLTVTSIEEFVGIINEADTSEMSNDNLMKQSIDRIKKDGYIPYPFIDGEAAELEVGVFYPLRGGETAILPAELLCNVIGGEYQFRVYIFYLDSTEEVAAAKEFGSNGIMEARRGKTIEQMQASSELQRESARMILNDETVNVEKYNFDGYNYTKISNEYVLFDNMTSQSDILIKENEKYQMAEYVVYDEFMIRVYGGLKTEEWTNTVDMSIFDHLTIEKVPLQK